jgi:hypothetical protein
MGCSCGYQFVFAGRGRDKITDNKFKSIIQIASKKNTVYFTKDQLFVAYCRLESMSKLKVVIINAILGIILAGILAYNKAPLSFIIGLPILTSFGGFFFWKKNKISRKTTTLNTFNEIYNKWIQKKGKIEKLIEKPELHKAPPQWNHDDIYDYGVEKILVVQKDIMVDLFVKNDFHAEQRCLVISASGYPNYLVSIAKKCTQENVNIKIFYLHDSSREGVESFEKFKNSGLLDLTNQIVIDLGLYPDDVKKMKFLQKTYPELDDYSIATTTIPYSFLAAFAMYAIVNEVSISDAFANISSETSIYNNTIEDYG